MTFLKIAVLCLIVLFNCTAMAEEIGSVSTVYKFMSPDDKIVVEAFDDPKIDGVACHLSRAKKGGMKSVVGMAEDPSNASIACRQIGPIVFKEEFKDGEEVFSKRASIIFKKIHVVRFLDKKRNTLIYLVYSDKIIEGSPQNSISTVPVMTWK